MQEYIVTSLIEHHEVNKMSTVDLLAVSLNHTNNTVAIRVLCVPSEQQRRNLLGSTIRIDDLISVEDSEGTQIKCISLKRLNHLLLSPLPKLIVDNLLQA